MPEPQTADMSVKQFPVDLRHRIAASAKEGEGTMTKWFVTAAENELARRAGMRVTPPVTTAAAPVRTVDLDSLRVATSALDAIAAAAAAGLPISARTRQQAMSALYDGLRELRGLPPLLKRERKPLVLNGSRVPVELNGEGLVHDR